MFGLLKFCSEALCRGGMRPLRAQLCRRSRDMAGTLAETGKNALAFAVLCLLSGPAYSSDCNDIVDRHNQAVQSEKLGLAAQILNECTSRCEAQRNICATLSVVLQSAARSLIEKKSDEARAVEEAHPASALRLNRQIVELGAVNPGVNAASIGEAARHIQMLEPLVHKRIAELSAQGYARLAANDYDAVRDIVYEIYAFEYGSKAGRTLAERAAQQYETYIAKETAASDAMLKDMMRRIRLQDGRKPRHAEIQNIVDVVSGLISMGLEFKPGDKKLLKLDETAKAAERELSGRFHLSVRFKDADSNAKASPEIILLKAQRQLAAGDFAGVIDLTGRIIGSLDPNHAAQAYVLRGLTHAVQINVDASHSLESREQKLSALADFNKAVSIAPDVRMPRGYEQYAVMLDESRNIG